LSNWKEICGVDFCDFKNMLKILQNGKLSIMFDVGGKKHATHLKIFWLSLTNYMQTMLAKMR